MKLFIIFLFITILQSTYVPAIANTFNSTKISLNVSIKERTSCQFEFSVESKNNIRAYSSFDIFDCVINTNKLLEKASAVAPQTTQIENSNRVRVVITAK